MILLFWEYGGPEWLTISNHPHKEAWSSGRFVACTWWYTGGGGTRITVSPRPAWTTEWDRPCFNTVYTETKSEMAADNTFKVECISLMGMENQYVSEAVVTGHYFTCPTLPESCESSCSCARVGSGRQPCLWDRPSRFSIVYIRVQVHHLYSDKHSSVCDNLEFTHEPLELEIS